MEAQQEQHHSGISMDFALFGRNLALFQLQERRKKGCGVFSQSPSPGEAALVSPDPTGNVSPQLQALLGLCLGIFSIPCNSQPGMLHISLKMFNQVEKSLLLLGPDEL